MPGMAYNSIDVPTIPIELCQPDFLAEGGSNRSACDRAGHDDQRMAEFAIVSVCACSDLASRYRTSARLDTLRRDADSSSRDIHLVTAAKIYLGTSRHHRAPVSVRPDPLAAISLSILFPARGTQCLFVAKF